MKSRRGVSLVELLLTMSACTVILTMSAALIHRVMHTQSKMRAFHDTQRSALRLANAFRHDVGRASGAETNATELANDVFLRLQIGEDEIVEYRHTEGNVTREYKQGANPTSHEAFVFPAEIELAVRQEPPNRICLTIAPDFEVEATGDGPPPSIAHTTPAHLQVEATLNRNPRIAAAKVAKAAQEASP
jgi:hypothetical protein